MNRWLSQTRVMASSIASPKRRVLRLEVEQRDSHKRPIVIVEPQAQWVATPRSV